MTEQKSKVYEDIVQKLKNNKTIPTTNKAGVKIRKVTVFEDIIIRNLDNLDTIALEINDTKLTYKEFFVEVEKYMNSFNSLGLKEGDVVSLCLPVSVEFICSYFAITALGLTCNALNIMFLLSEGVKPYLDERCSNTLICDENYYKLLQMNNVMNDAKLKTLIITGDATYNHLKSDSEQINILGKNIPNTNIMTLNDFLKKDIDEKIKLATYNENRMATLNYTSGTTGKPKCMGHSDLAPLFLVAAHDGIKREEYRKDRTLLTIPLQHPTGLFYSMVFQLAQGKTLVLEPIYDKKLFYKDIKEKNINHAVQAKPFYAQLIQDRKDGLLKPGDFENFRNPYSGGEGIPLSVCRDINDTLHYAGCPNSLYLGYGRSEEGSLTINAYNLEGRENVVGVPLPGIKAKLVNPKTLEDLPYIEGAKGEILVNTPVTPLHHCYLGPYNKIGKPDNSIVDSEGKRWARAKDIAKLVKLPNNQLAYITLGRSYDLVEKDGEEFYLFDLKEKISNIPGVQECEVLTMPNVEESIVTVHLVIKDEYLDKIDEIQKAIYELTKMIDGIKIYDSFGINATSGKCDRESMCRETTGYYSLENGKICETTFVLENNHAIKKLVRK